MVELALESHSSILIDSTHTKEVEKRAYIGKCVDELRKVGLLVRFIASRTEFLFCLCAPFVSACTGATAAEFLALQLSSWVMATFYSP